MAGSGREQKERLIGDHNGKSQALDGGWGWMVVFGSFMTFLVAGGVTYSFGIFFVEIVNEFNGSKSGTSWIGSILLGVTYGVGPFASMFINRYGCRAAAITGALVAATGFGLGYFANSVLYLYGSLGLIGGIGMGLMYLPAVICVSLYFDKKRALATGIAVCGSGIGTFSLAPFYNYLISQIGWRLSLVAVAGTLLSCTAIGLLFRPLKPIRRQDEIEHLSYEAGVKPESSSKMAKTLAPSDYGSCSTMTPVSEPFTRPITPQPQTSKSQLETLPTDPALLTPGSDKWSKSFSDTTLSVDSGLGTGTSYAKVVSKAKPWGGKALLLSPLFVFLAISNFLTNVGENVPYVYLADLAKEEFTLVDKDTNLGWLVSCIGISNTISRVFLGYLSDAEWVNRFYIYRTLLIVCGVVTAMIPLGNSMLWLYVCAVMFGASDGVYASLSPVILGDFLGVDKLSDALGIVLMFQGFGTLIGPPIVGALFDYFGNYVYGFAFSGTLMSLSGAMLLFIPIVQHWESVKADEKRTS